MARKKTSTTTPGDNPKQDAHPPAVSWADLTWADLDRWAGSRTVERGRSYQRGGRVQDLVISEVGELLATVVGGERYATMVTLSGSRKRPALESSCTCPVGFNCKHAVATVAAYLDAVAGGRAVPIAPADDPRWEDLDAWDDEDEDDDFEVERPRAPKATGRRKAAEADWDAKIERHIRSKPEGELADLVWSLTRRFPEIYREFRERIALQEGDVDRLVAEARQEIRRVTSEPAWQNHWSDEGHTPDYSPIRHRLERLLELGHADAVVTLGRLLLKEGMRQVRESDDEGETLAAFSKCLPVVFEAVARSSLSGPDRLLLAIDAELEDGYDAIGEAIGPVLDAPYPPEDWSSVADALADRMKSIAARGDRESDRFISSYNRDRIADWVATALENAGRDGELEALYEAEARATLSYVRLVAFLREHRRYDDAERWANEGIAATIDTYPGLASQLTASLRELARARRRWDVVAAHAAHDFFEAPRPSGFDELIKAARKAKVEAPVRAAALRFLETGAMPYRVIAPKPAPAPARSRSKSPALKRAEATRPAASAPGPDRLEIDPEWPLPVPESLIPVLKRERRYDAGPRPHLDVLLQMAIAARRPDEVLRWYDRMRAGAKRPGSYADSVAEAVSDAFPGRAIEIYRDALDAQLPHAQQAAYQAAAGYLRKLRPLYEALGRSGEWEALLAEIRGSYRNRPRFMEQLERLDDRPIVQSSRSRRR